MNIYLAMAAILAVALGLIHSAFGEYLIFRHWRILNQNNQKISGLPIGFQRIIWASWHIVTLFGFGVAALLCEISSVKPNENLPPLVENILSVTLLGCSFLVLIGTRGRHPGWFVLMLIVALIWAA